MTLKELMNVVPAYATVHVHDQKGHFAHRGNPFDFTGGLYSKYDSCPVVIAVPLSSYTMEVTVEEVPT